MNDRGRGAVRTVARTSRSPVGRRAGLAILGVMLASALGVAMAGARDGSASAALPEDALELRSSPVVLPEEGAAGGSPRTSPDAVSDAAPAVTGTVAHGALASAEPGPLDDARSTAPIPARLPATPVPARAASRNAAGKTDASKTAAGKVAEPWCRTGRIAGTGTGFCLIN